MSLYQCPCCDYFSLDERGEYSICSVCFWGDSGWDVDCPDEYSGPNHMTLREGRRNFQYFGACDYRMLKSVLPPAARSRYRHSPRVLRRVASIGVGQ